MRVREKNDLSRWFKFFLLGVIETAKSGITTFDNILHLKKISEEKTGALGSRAANAQKVLNSLYLKPITDVAAIAALTGLSSASAYKLAADLEKLGILHEITGSKRGKLYLFQEYLDFFK